MASAFSFLRGASSPEELAATASVLGLSAIGITDLNSVAGVVRMWDAAKEVGIRLVVGARLSFRDDTPDLLCYPQDRAAWGRLTRLLTVGKGRVPHGDTSDAAKATNRCFLHYADLLEHGEGQLLLAVAPDRLDDGFRQNLQRLKRIFAVGRILPPTVAIVVTMPAVCARWQNCRCRWWRPTTCSTICPIGDRCRM